MPAAVTEVAGSATSVSLIAANPLRRDLWVFNKGPSTAYVRAGDTAATTTTGHSLQILPGQLWEIPKRGEFVNQEAFQVIFSAATGGVQVTELT